MEDNKAKSRTMFLFRMLAFTWISALTFITCAFVFFVMPNTRQLQQIIDYTNCLPIYSSYKTCAEERKPNQQLCKCIMDFNLTKNLYGEFSVYCQLELSQQDNKYTNASEGAFTDVPSSSENCNPYTSDKTISNDSCKGIPDSIFSDSFYLIQTLSNESEVNMGSFTKSTRWSSDVMDTDENRKITVLMKSNWTSGVTEMPIGSYQFQIIYYFWDERYNGRRKFVLSSQDLAFKYRMNVIRILSLVVGLICLIVSSVLTILRKRIQGTETEEYGFMSHQNEHIANNGQPDSSAEERPLSSSVNN